MKYTDFCDYCGAEYEPQRRGVQRFCSNSCRSRKWQLKQKNDQLTIIDEAKVPVTEPSKPMAKTKITTAAIGNAAIGTAAVDLTKHLLTPEPKRNATKEDVRKLSSIIKGQRYFPVRNMALDHLGRNPLYDIETETIIYK
ncbi:hypothetical protein [Winogradskyella ursingii]|uniref:hypothetical protein n=1 Tax=Winogradskyella ursingii TaxID=2686079 RepID=UPI0015CDF7FC|nr:hypothetical protein [Winogradskyella ursingii]